MDFKNVNSGVWEKVKNKVINLSQTSYGKLALKAMTSTHKHVNTQSEGFENFGFLNVKHFTHEKLLQPSNNNVLNKLPDEGHFLDFAFNKAQKESSKDLPDHNMFLEFSKKIAEKKPVSVEDKINQLMEEKRIKALSAPVRTEAEYFVGELQKNINDPHKDFIQKLETFCEIAEGFNFSSRGLLHRIRMTDQEGIEFRNIVTESLDNSLKTLTSSEANNKVEKPKRNKLKI